MNQILPRPLSSPLSPHVHGGKCPCRTCPVLIFFFYILLVTSNVPCRLESPLNKPRGFFICAFAKLQKVTITVVMSALCVCVCVCVRPSVCPSFRPSVRPPAPDSSAPIRRIFMKFDIQVFFGTLSGRFKFH